MLSKDKILSTTMTHKRITELFYLCIVSFIIGNSKLDFVLVNDKLADHSMLFIIVRLFLVTFFFEID